MPYKLLIPLFVFLLSIGSIFAIACGDDDDDDDDDTAEGDDDTTDDDAADDDAADDDATDDDATDDDDSAGGDVCKNGEAISPVPDPGMTADSICTTCHDGTTAAIAHDGLYDDGAPTACMAAGCHACP